ncbi:exopolysaccharide production protein ExoZ [Sphingobium jiangsuense]|uniref:Exopolysaccharide production protein ExoZ n=1 Tax=Sphingobium jiangsuense TaxID=870476 RepID=A0A7W6BLJ4_9SPHN|nr:acyltransferase [Sphingobium jiangsuense]MBB3924848.1 exopolysaccharide production protein ExoZ [Sphingobium jiangsuense]
MKIRSIHYWRVVAALMVVVAHTLLHPLPFPTPSLRRLGSFGVLLFFVISGFIMVYTTGKANFDPWRFLRRRMERIVPLYWLVTFAVAALAIAAPWLLKNTEFSVRQLILSCLFIPYARGDGEIVPLMKLGWSLNYEMFFYLVFACASRLRAAARVAAVTGVFLLLVLLGTAIGGGGAIVTFFTQPVILSFCVGMGIGLWYLHGGMDRGSPAAPVLAIAAAGLIAAGFLIPTASAINPATDGLFTLAAAAMLVLGLRVEHRLPASPAGLLLGDASYAMYLVHMYVVGAVILVGQRLGHGSAALDLLLTIGITIAASVLIHLRIERPIGKALRGWRPRPAMALG